MWVGEWSSFEGDVPKIINCKNHSHTLLLEPVDFSRENPPELHAAIKFRIDQLYLHLMDPFVFGVPYNLKRLSEWAHEAGLLPERGIILDGSVDEKTRSIIILMNTASYHMVILHMSLWTHNDKCLTIRSLVREQFDHYTDLVSCRNIDQAIKCMERNTFFPYFIERLASDSKHLNKRMACAAFVICHYYMYDVREDNSWEHSAEVDMHFAKNMEFNSLKEKGNSDFKQQQYMQAIASYTLAIKQWPYNPYLYGNRAQCYLKLHKWSDAEIDGYRAVILKSYWCKGYYRLSQALNGQGRSDDAYKIAQFGILRCHDKFSCPELPDLMTHSKNLQKKEIVPTTSPRKRKRSSKKNTTQDTKQQTTVQQVKLAIVEDVPELVSDSTTSSDSDDPPLPQPAKNPQKEAIKSEENLSVASTLLKSLKNTSKMPPRDVTGDKDSLSNKFAIQQAEKQIQNGGKPKVQEITNSIGTFNMEEETKKGSDALLSSRPRQAVDHFQRCLLAVIENPSRFPYVKNDDIVILRYSLGMALVEIGLHEELQKALHTFDKIITDHRNVRFPAVYYGIGCAYMKLNRYKDALEQLHKGLLIVERNIAHATYTWPGSTVVIKETKSAHLAQELKKLILMCKYPPPPDAVCTYRKCSSIKEIRYSDPDFKGFVQLHCSDRCRIQYHPSCWKSLKSEEDLQEKDILNKPCYTPDCDAVVVYIGIRDKDGTLAKDWLHESAQNNAKNKHRKSKLERKLAQRRLQKTQKKSKRVRCVSGNSNNDSGSDDEDHAEETKNGCLPEQLNESGSTNDKVLSTQGLAQKEPVPATKVKKPVTVQPDVRNDGEAKFILTKTKEPKEILSAFIKNKHNKREKKALKEKKTKMTVDEFCGDWRSYTAVNSYLSRMQKLREKNQIAMKDSESSVDTFPLLGNNSISSFTFDPNNPFALPPELRDDHVALDAFLKWHCDLEKDMMFTPQHTKIYQVVQDFLCANGPLAIDSELWTDIADSFSTEEQQLISERGGLIPFLFQSVRFLQVCNYICLPFDAQKAYTMYTESLHPMYWSAGTEDLGLTTIFGDTLSDPFEPVVDFVSNGSFPDDSITNLNSTSVSSFLSESVHLNPTAPEYNPKDLIPAEEFIHISGIENSINDGSGVGPVLRPLPSCESLLYPECVSRGRNSNSLIIDANVAISSSPLIEQTCDTLVSSKAPESVKNSMVHKSNTSVETPLSRGDSHSTIESTSEDSERDFESVLDKAYPLFKLLLMLDKKRTVEFFSRMIKLDVSDSSKKLSNKIIQAGTGMVTSTSQSVQVGDYDELRVLQDCFEELQCKKQNLEERLQETLDSLAQLQKKASVEIPLLQKQLTDSQEESDRLQSQLEQERETWSKERKKLQQEKKKTADDLKNSQQKLQAVNFQKDMLDQKVKELSAKLQEAENNIQQQMQSHDPTLLNTLWAGCEESAERAKKAEVEVLRLKKNEVVQKMNDLIEKARKKIVELESQKSCQVGTVLIPLNHQEWTQYAETLQRELSKFVVAVDSQIDAVQKGRPISALEPFPKPNLPKQPAVLPLSSVAQLPRNTILTRPFSPSTYVHVPHQTPSSSTNTLLSASGGPSSSFVSMESAARKTSKSSQEKLMQTLKSSFPNLSEDQLQKFVGIVRMRNNNTLSRMTFQTIVTQVAEVATSELGEKQAAVGGVKIRPKVKKVAAHLNFRAESKRTDVGLDRIDSSAKCPWANAPAATSKTWKGEEIQENSCSICLDEYTPNTSRKLDCGHVFHSKCIQSWVQRERTCPNCRLLVLTEDEFPVLD